MAERTAKRMPVGFAAQPPVAIWLRRMLEGVIPDNGGRPITRVL